MSTPPSRKRFESSFHYQSMFHALVLEQMSWVTMFLKGYIVLLLFLRNPIPGQLR